MMIAAVLALVAVEVSSLRAQPSRSPKSSAATPGAHHGTPKGWKFNWPKGDAAKGREVFQKLECYSCHEVTGEKFPAPTDRNKVGPELSVMGPMHDADYFAEAILNPGAVIEKGQGYQAADGSSKMPSFNDSMTVQELVDLVAFVKGLKPPGKAPAGAATGAPASGGHRGH
jgi:mono/diheme cytochrome c family protein